MAPNARIRFRRGIAAIWRETNPILAAGEPGFERDTKRMKIGDGETAWNDLPYTPSDDRALQEHHDSPAPHPAYDDAPSLTLIYANAKV